jgi:tetratricopeptide (TPR) repeat protein
VPAAAALLALAVLGARSLLARRAAAPVEPPVVAVGAVRDYSGSDTSGIARALTDMLATNLARVPHLRVVSNARIYEILGEAQPGVDPAARLGAAARHAGAREMVEGTLYRHRPGVLRFDVRRVDLATGAIRKAYSVEGADAFELVDRATAEVASDVSPGEGVRLHVADVTTRSLVAYRFYEEGLHALYQKNDMQAARRLFLAALGEDSTFAMAEYYAARCESLMGMPTGADRFIHAARLADRATDRERLLIRATASAYWNQPSQRAIAETLATRYPDEPDGHFLRGGALLSGGDFLASIPHFRRVIEMDSLSLRGATNGCRACEALHAIVTAYWLADSLPAAERTAREWIRLQPGSARAWATLAEMLMYQDRYGQMSGAMRMVSRMQGTEPDWHLAVLTGIRRADFAAADSLLRRRMREYSANDAPWFLVLSLRYQGRLREALAVARAARPRAPDGARSSDVGLAEAIVLSDMGRSREAAAAFAAIAATPNPTFATPSARPQLRSRYARDEAWNLTHAATALAMAGDTPAVARLADSIEHVGALSGYGRDPRLHHYVRGLLLRARGQLPEAAEEFRRGLFSLTDGYTRNSYELARTLLALHRPKDAIAVLQPALRGSLEASNTYVTHTELHEALGQTFEAVAQPDSAAVHYAYVVRAWASADAPFRARWERARARLAVINRGN